jgi:hypothetical protein
MGVVIAYILNDLTKPFPVTGNLTVLNICTDEIAKDAAKIFMSWIG